jgi:hypothetical protein
MRNFPKYPLPCYLAAVKTGVETASVGKTLALFDEKLRLDPGQALHLYLQLSDHEISAALFSPRKNNFLALASAPLDPSRLADFLEETSLLQRGSISHSRVILAGSAQTLLPRELYRAGDIGEVLDFNYGPAPDSVAMAQPVAAIDAQLLFRFPSAWNAACQALLPAPGYVHHLAGLVEALFLQFKNRNEPVVLLHLRQGHADIVVKRGRKLLLLNSFPCQGVEDVLYHTLNVYEQLQLNPEEDLLVLAGALEKDSAVYGLLSGYFSKPVFVTRPAVAGYSYAFDSVPAHQFYSLFSPVLCES